mmetsp:Transcript_20138/g.49476  ORF Transcript_20138/g.49476 Transcript_20138/m.49476 type:complete len:329 (+) Transcript_20138:384-1370(+)|eukprot:CAMPEP_0206226166 /NCGR_PEP_ID=MMETSP0047_2-20121206/7926_1 /ASSEMBLY_ACC=CAM_ASM_000192 /TAXON_ID=195065 /ORGANISM="Chroomonas mesostigmatica_cf, Strain CCMP1168" /LENGTH=328 /DNA_ID=CAMNT_0053649195 /DNA_START=316 /DNA_END=1302 /DNA_ORIENTATION=+
MAESASTEIPQTMGPVRMLPVADPQNTLFDPNLTYHWDKYSCVRDMYFAHVFFCYAIGLSGLACFITRIHPRVKWMHKWFGQIYILSMIWATATSLLIHNTGLPAAVLISFLWVLSGLTVGWVAIKFHMSHIQTEALKAVQEDIKISGLTQDLELMVEEKKGQIVRERTWVQRFFSWKTFHACVMFVSWINIVGRIFNSNQSGDFTCHTYPVYKPIDTPEFMGSNTTLTFVPIHDPKYSRLPWANSLTQWGLMLSLGPLFGTAAIGLVYSCVVSKRSAHARHDREMYQQARDDGEVGNNRPVVSPIGGVATGRVSAVPNSGNAETLFT